MNLSQIAKKLNITYLGNPDKVINGLSSPQNVRDGTLCYISDKNCINDSLINAGAILTHKDLVKHIPNKNFLIAENPKFTFAHLSCFFAKSCSPLILDKNKNFYRGRNVIIGNNFEVGIGVIIEDDVKIGNNVNLSHNVVLHQGVEIGNNVSIGAGTVIGCEGFGNVRDNSKKWKHICHLGSVIIHENVSIGSNCTIDRGTIENTIINQGVIIDNLVHIAHNVEIGEYTAIAAKVGIAGSTTLGKRNLIGGMVGIIDHISTADDVTVSATSTVNKHLKNSGIYTGIMPISKHASWKRIALWITKLDKIAKLINLRK